MSPEKARVIIVDDDADVIETLTEFLEAGRHHVVGTASTMESGQALITRKKKIDVALLDSNLDPSDDHINHGSILARLFRRLHPGKKVISISTQPQTWSDTPNLTYSDGGNAITDAVTKS